MSERTLILPVKTVRDPAYNHYLGPVEYNCYEFDNGDKAHSVLFYTYQQGYEPYRHYFQAVVDQDNNYTYPPTESVPVTETAKLIAIAEAVTELIIAQAEYEPEAKPEVEATTSQLQPELALVQ